jgi:hypothetical protein
MMNYDMLGRPLFGKAKQATGWEKSKNKAVVVPDTFRET